MKSILIGLLALILFADLAEARQDLIQEFAKYNKLYEEGKFNEARVGYQKLLTQIPSSGHLHYNIGNSWFKSGQYGQAIHHYLKAHQSLPRDEDVEANLSMAFRKTVDIWDGRRDSPASAVLFWLNDFTLQEHIRAIIILNFLFWIILATGLTVRNETLDKARQILTGLLVIAVLSTGARWHMENFLTVAVVSEKSLDVFSDEGNTNEVVLQLHEGAVLPVLDRKGEWIELELPNGKKGWVPFKAVLI